MRAGAGTFAFPLNTGDTVNTMPMPMLVRRSAASSLPTPRDSDRQTSSLLRRGVGTYLGVVARPLALAVMMVGAAHAADGKIGITVEVDTDGPFWNPVVNRLKVKAVDKASLAEAAGIVAGDEIVQIEGKVVAGRLAQDLKESMKFSPGETRTLRLKHTNGDQFDARITKPKP